MSTYTRIKESETAKKIGTGLSSAYNKTKENVQNPELLKENMKYAYEGTKNSINKGIEKVQDPEFRSGVKESLSEGLKKMKTKTENAFESVSNRFIDPPPQNLNRGHFEENENMKEDESPFDVMSDEEDDQEDSEVQDNQGNKSNTQDLNVTKEQVKKNNQNIQASDSDKNEDENVPIISEISQKSKELTPEPLDKIN